MAPRTDLLAWLLDSDPAIRWQVERDLLNEALTVWAATRASIATKGFGARLLSLQDRDGQWAGGAFFPAEFDFAGPEAAEQSSQPWTATTWTLNSLREWGLDASVLRERRTAELLAENCRWEYEAGRTGTVRSIAASTPGRWQTVFGSACPLMNWLIGLCGINFRMVGGTVSGSKVRPIVVPFDAQFTQRASRVRDRDRGNR